MRTIKRVLIASALAAMLLSAALASPAGARQYANFKDINCPMWRTDEPVAIYGVIAANANALCVKAYGGHVWGAGPFKEQRPQIWAALRLERLSGGKWRFMDGDTYRADSTCFKFEDSPLPYKLWILQIEWVYLCTPERKLHTQTGVFPPRGCYRTRLRIRTESEHLLDVKSYQRCF